MGLPQEARSNFQEAINGVGARVRRVPAQVVGIQITSGKIFVWGVDVLIATLAQVSAMTGAGVNYRVVGAALDTISVDDALAVRIGRGTDAAVVAANLMEFQQYVTTTTPAVPMIWFGNVGPTIVNDGVNNALWAGAGALSNNARTVFVSLFIRHGMGT